MATCGYGQSGRVRSTRQTGRLVRFQRLGDAQSPRRAAGPIETGRPGDDAVEVLGKALRLLHRLTSTGGTAVPVRKTRAGVVVGSDDLLRGHGHLMHRPPPEVDHLLGMTETEARGVADVPGIRRAGRVATTKRGDHRAIGNRPGERPVADRLKSFPFQSTVGIHTSILMSESLDGVRVAVTRQNAGKPPYIRAAAADGGLPPSGTGGANAPASTATAAVIVVLDNTSDARLSHDVAGPFRPVHRPLLSQGSRRRHTSWR